MKTQALKFLAVMAGLCTVAGNLAGQVVVTNLYSFEGNFENDGAAPYAGLVQGSDGNFYGTCRTGGASPNDSGTIFKISPGGVETTLHTFLGTLASPSDGSLPQAPLVQGSDGNFYGTTSGGGSNEDVGTVFRITPGGSESVLYTFGSYPTDGAEPEAPLVLGTDGSFYGTTVSGGTNVDSLGTIFRISPGGVYTNLYSFNGYPVDGNNPRTGLVEGSDGNFYGMANEGGTNGYGTIYRISPDGSYANLYSFTGYINNDGDNPDAELVQGSDGNFYGTTIVGGIADGNVFRLTVPLSLPVNQISDMQVAGGNVLVSIPSVSGEMYQLQDRGSLTTGAWVNVAGQVPGAGGLLTVTNFGGFSQPEQFYRFSIVP